MAGINAVDRTALQRSVSKLKREMADIGRANTPEMRAAGNVLARSIRKELSVKGALYLGPSRGRGKVRGIPSAPGEPPHRITSKLYKSVGTEVVGGVLRVGESYFTSRLLELGVDATMKLRSGKLRRRKGGIATRRIRIAPRPFMKRALANALPKMGDEFIGTLKKHTIGGGSSVVS
jgi:hypothetical protein